MPKYWGKQILAHGRFLEVGQKQKTEKKKKRAKVGGGQATHCARKHSWRTQAAWARNGQLHIANATSCCARKATWARINSKCRFWKCNGNELII